MMYLIVGDDALRFVVIFSTRIQVPIKAREVAARHLDAYSMSSLEKIARDHRLQRHFIYFAGFHPDVWFVVAIAITHALDRFVEIKRTAVGVDVNQFDREIRVLCIRRHIECDFNWPTYFHAFAQRLGGVDEYVRPRLVLTLIEGAS